MSLVYLPLSHHRIVPLSSLINKSIDRLHIFIVEPIRIMVAGRLSGIATSTGHGGVNRYWLFTLSLFVVNKAENRVRQHGHNDQSMFNGGRPPSFDYLTMCMGFFFHSGTWPSFLTKLLSLRFFATIGARINEKSSNSQSGAGRGLDLNPCSHACNPSAFKRWAISLSKWWVRCCFKPYFRKILHDLYQELDIGCAHWAYLGPRCLMEMAAHRFGTRRSTSL